jgi:SAM-dependent methyltransferase
VLDLGVKASPGTILHVGSGHASLPTWCDGLAETRLDIDPGCKPDIIAPMTDMGDIGPFDVLYCSHALEHLYPHDVAAALAEFRRVLKPGGAMVVFVPDLEDVQATEDVVYQSPCGPITGLDMIYGKVSYLADAPFMAHHTGFVRDTLAKTLEAAGFSGVTVLRVPEFNLMGSGRA